MLRWIAPLVLAVTLTACATAQVDERCSNTDWYALGLADGRAGHPAERIAQHRKACAKLGIEPDELRYLQGRRDGIGDYCRPENAFREGLAGRDYQGGCDATFARNHRAAHDVATLRKEVEANRSAIGWREAEIRGNSASDARRDNLRREVRDLERTRETLRPRLQRAEQELQRLRLLTPLVALPATTRVALPRKPDSE
jgi:hypothetical protein